MNRIKQIWATAPKRYGKILLAVLAVFLLIFPQIFSMYMVRISCTVFCYAVLALSLNILTGYCGILSMGHSAFFCVGAYAAALLMIHTGCNWLIAAIFAFFVAALLGLILGLPTLRLSGSFLVMVTIGFSEIVRTVALVWKDLTNGPLGIKSIPLPSIGGFTLSLYNGGLYYLGLLLVVIFALICAAIKYSKWGRVMNAIKDDELAVAMIGLKPTNYKILAFVLGSAIAGFMGAYYASLLGFIDPSTFTADMSRIILCAVLLGGLGSIPGMAIGAVTIIAIQEAFRFAMEFRLVVFGLMLILLMKYAPSGLLGAPSKKPYRLPKGVEVHHGGKQ